MGAGLLGTVHGGLNLFSRPLGGIVSDRIAVRHGLNGRVLLLLAVLLLEGMGLLWFSQVAWLPLAVVALATFALFSQMACGATYAIVPFVNRRSLGSVSGIVGAGGNVGAVMAGFLFKSSLDWSSSLLLLGLAVTTVAFLALAVRFPQEAELEAGRELHARHGELAMEPTN
jgi:NNP family nitrate/nitrite transporter-like MFS transporter